MATATKERPKTKEPWEMTKAERATYMEQAGREAIQKWNEAGSKGFPPSNPERWGVVEVNRAADALGMPWGEERIAIPQHKYEVMVALKQGKPVPPEVLKDYPELSMVKREGYLKEQALKEHQALIAEEVKKAGNREVGMKVAADRLGKQVDSRTGVVDPENIKAAKLIREAAKDYPDLGKATPVTPKVTGNLYRWSNLREIVKTSKGERVTSLDVSDSPDFYFSPYNSRKQIGGGKSWLDNTYLRVILDRGKLTSAGWVKDPVLKAEGAWRHIGKKADTDLARDYTLAIKGIEVDDIPAGKTLEDILAIVEFRLGRKVPVVASDTLKVAGEVTPVTTEGMAIPKAAKGMPEAGLQLDISGKTTPVMPKGKARYATASMEDYGKLQQMRAEAAGTISHEDSAEIIAGLDLRAEALAGRIDRGKAELESMKETTDPRIAKLTALIPTAKGAEGELSYITKGQYLKVWGREPKKVILTPDGKRVRWEYALDEIAQELHLEPIAQAQGKAPDEYLKELIEDARDQKRAIDFTESEIAGDEATLTAMDRLKLSVKAMVGKATLESLAKPKVSRPERVALAGARVSRAKAKSKPERKAEKMLAEVARALIEKTQRGRKPLAIAIDNAILASKVVPLSQASVWAKNPNRLDIRGIDTPGRGKIVTGVGYADKGAKRLSRKPRKGWRKVKLA